MGLIGKGAGIYKLVYYKLAFIHIIKMCFVGATVTSAGVKSN